MYVLTKKGMVLSGSVISESTDKVRLFLSESEEESWYDKKRCAFNVKDLIHQAVDNDFTWSFAEEQFDRKNSNALYSRLQNEKEGLYDMPIAIPDNFDYSTILKNKLDLDVQMTIKEWVECTITDESEERTEYYGLPSRKGEEEQQWSEEYVRLDIYNIEEYPHTISGRSGKLCKYACHEGAEPSAETLRPWDETDWSPWSYSVKSHTNTGRYGYSSAFKGVIHRNGVMWNENHFRNEAAALLWCQHEISQFTHYFYGADLRMKSWKEELAGSKITWKGLPITVGYIVVGQAAFCSVETILDDEERDTVKLDFFDPNIDWFPEFHTEDVAPELVVSNDAGSKEEEHD